MEQEQKDEVFLDGETFGGGGFGNKDEVSFRGTVMGYNKLMGKFAGVEWTGGYWMKRLLPNGQIFDYYVPDAKEVYSNGVDYLADILYPHFDPAMKKAEEEIEKEIAKVRDKIFADNTDKTTAIQEFKREKVVLKRKLFRCLNGFLNRKKYFENERLEE